MDNRNETEAEMRARLKEELKAELLAELKDEQAKEEKKTNTNVYPSDIEKVKANPNDDRGVKEATELLNRDKQFATKNDGPKMYQLPQAKDEETGSLSIVLVIIVVALIIASYIFLPKIYKWVANKETPSTYVDPDKDNEEEPSVELEQITLSSKSVQNLTYPIMRNNPYTSKTYFSKSVLNIGDLSNNDLLYNAFIHIYKGNIATYTGGYSGEYCVAEDEKKTFNAKYIDARMENLFTKSVEYEHKTFKVPSTNGDTTYVGTWKYDSKNNRYIYYGDCNPVSKTTTEYYDLKVAYDAKGLEKNNIIEVYYHIAFAKINTSTMKYNIYSDAAMKNSILSGELKTKNYESELQEIFSTYVNEQKETSKYKFTFSKQDCSYQNYCFEKGEWIEGI